MRLTAALVIRRDRAADLDEQAELQTQRFEREPTRRAASEEPVGAYSHRGVEVCQEALAPRAARSGRPLTYLFPGSPPQPVARFVEVELWSWLP